MTPHDDLARYWWWWLILGVMLGTLVGWAIAEFGA